MVFSVSSFDFTSLILFVLVSGGIGAFSLQEAAAELETELLQGGCSNAALQLFLQRQKTFYAALHKVMFSGGEKNTEAVLQPGNAAELLTILQELAPCLKKRQPRPCQELLARLQKKEWPKAWQERVGGLQNEIRRYRFDAAALECRNLMDLLAQDRGGEKGESETADFDC